MFKPLNEPKEFLKDSDNYSSEETVYGKELDKRQELSKETGLAPKNAGFPSAFLKSTERKNRKQKILYLEQMASGRADQSHAANLRWYLQEQGLFVSVVNPYEMKKYRSQG